MGRSWDGGGEKSVHGRASGHFIGSGGVVSVFSSPVTVEIRRRSEYGFRHKLLSYNWHRTWENLYTDFSWSVMSTRSKEAVGTWLASPRCRARVKRQVEDDASPVLTSRRGKRVRGCLGWFLGRIGPLVFSYFFTSILFLFHFLFCYFLFWIAK
jgi:hypothetical protein